MISSQEQKRNILNRVLGMDQSFYEGVALPKFALDSVTLGHYPFFFELVIVCRELEGSFQGKSIVQGFEGQALVFRAHDVVL